MRSMLRQAREQKGLKTREVARLLNIDVALISKFESGQRLPTKEQVFRLAELLEIDTNELLTLWLKEKILHLIKGETLGLDALKMVLAEIEPEVQTQQKNSAIDALFDEMEALKNKLEGLRNS